MQASPSFISRVPADVLIYIFQLGTICVDCQVDIVSFPLLISHVCYQWRELALQTSTLWTTIDIFDVSESFTLPDSPAVDELAPQRAFPFAALFLERSRTRPINVRIDLRSETYDFELSDYENQINSVFSPLLSRLLSFLLAPHAMRFKEFRFLSDIFLPIIDVLSCLSSIPMPQLEKWEVQRCDIYHCFEDMFEPRGTTNALSLFSRPVGVEEHAAAYTENLYPNLKHAVLSGTPLRWSHFSLTNLKSLSLNYLANEVRPTFTTLRHILLANEHSLEKLEIQGAAPADIGPPYVLSNVRKLTLGYTFPEEAFGLVCTLKTPNLTELVITDLARYLTPESNRPQTRADQSAMVVFAAVMRCMPLHKIQHLGLGCVMFYSPDMGWPHDIPTRGTDPGKLPFLLAFLRSMSSLKSLTLDEPDKALMHFLNCPILCPKDDNGGRPCVSSTPNLTHLSLRRIDFPEIRLFFSTRAKFAGRPNEYIIPPLQEVKLHADVGDEDLEWLSVNCVDTVKHLVTHDPSTDDDDSEGDVSDREAMDVDVGPL